jgi:hypothetical protein
MAQKNVPGHMFSVFCNLRRFSGIFYGNMNYTLFPITITKIWLFLASSQCLLSYEHIKKPEVQSGAGIFQSEK